MSLTNNIINKFPEVRINEFGFYQLVDIPNLETLKTYYERKYYQENKGSYQSEYNKAELIYLKNKIEEKEYIIDKLLTKKTTSAKCLLDIGCGEGWTLKYFLDKGWDIQGLDYSVYGCEKQNPEVVEYVLVGDINDKIESLNQKGKKFDVIWLDNVLEHVVEPTQLLQKIKCLSHYDTILIIEVPNDFSITQLRLLENKDIDSPFWIVSPDHISYFNLNGLNNLCDFTGWKYEFSISDYPIDFNLFNPSSNYIRNKEIGKNSHRGRVEIDNLLHEISLEKKMNLYKALADLGLGRQIIGFYKLKN